MRVFVTGAGGYLGQAVVHHLMAEGAAAIAMEHHTRRSGPTSVRAHLGDVPNPRVPHGPDPHHRHGLSSCWG